MDAKRMAKFAWLMEESCRLQIKAGMDVNDMLEAAKFLRSEADKETETKSRPYFAYTPRSLVLSCRDHGVGISVNDDGFIWYHEPLMTIDPELWQEVQRRKAEVAAYLQAERAKEDKPKAKEDKPKAKEEKTNFWDCTVGVIVPDPKAGRLHWRTVKGKQVPYADLHATILASDVVKHALNGGYHAALTPDAVKACLRWAIEKLQKEVAA